MGRKFIKGTCVRETRGRDIPALRIARGRPQASSPYPILDGGEAPGLRRHPYTHRSPQGTGRRPRAVRPTRERSVQSGFPPGQESLSFRVSSGAPVVGRRVRGTFRLFASPGADPKQALPIPPLTEEKRPDCVDILIPTVVGKVPGTGQIGRASCRERV